MCPECEPIRENQVLVTHFSKFTPDLYANYVHSLLAIFLSFSHSIAIFRYPAWRYDHPSCIRGSERFRGWTLSSRLLEWRHGTPGVELVPLGASTWNPSCLLLLLLLLLELVRALMPWRSQPRIQHPRALAMVCLHYPGLALPAASRICAEDVGRVTERESSEVVAPKRS